MPEVSLHLPEQGRNPQKINLSIKSEMIRNGLDPRILMGTALIFRSDLVSSPNDLVGDVRLLLRHAYPLSVNARSIILEELHSAEIEDFYINDQSRGKGFGLGTYVFLAETIEKAFHVPIICKAINLTGHPDETSVEGPNEYGGYQLMQSLVRRGIAIAIVPTNLVDGNNSEHPEGFISIPSSVKANSELLDSLYEYYRLTIQDYPTQEDIDRIMTLRKILFPVTQSLP